MEKWRSERQREWGNGESGVAALGKAEVSRLNKATVGRLVPRVIRAPVVTIERPRAPAIRET